MMRGRGLLLGLLGAWVGCGGAGVFTLTSDDNNPVAIARALSTERKPALGAPANSTGRPMAFLVTAAAPKQILAWDLKDKKKVWAMSAEVSSRIVVGRSFLAAREGSAGVVARRVDTGETLWSYPIEAGQTFLGLAADGDQVFLVVKEGAGKAQSWTLLALGRAGKEEWRLPSSGLLGAPAARGGLVYVPFMNQWLTVLDAKNGQPVARVRQSDEAISFVRTIPEGVFYGSKGVILFDEKSAAGTRNGATYGHATFPEELVRAFYHYDAYSPIQATYSAYDRSRLLWRAGPGPGDAGLTFQDQSLVVFSFRFFFAFDSTSGALKWAHSHPRFDVVSAEHVGTAIVYVSGEGELAAIDPKTGARFAATPLGVRIQGATFDADGYLPDAEPQPHDTLGALSSMVWDRDARFDAAKLFALAVLGTLPGKEITSVLLRVVGDPSTSRRVYDKAGEVLVARKDEAALGILTEALLVPRDFLAGTEPRAIELVSRAIGAVGKAAGAPALWARLEDPFVPLPAVKDIFDALAACGSRDALPSMRAYLLTYRSDPMFASDTTVLRAATDALLALGSARERELVAYVATEPRTLPDIAAYATDALAQKDKADKAPKAGAAKPDGAAADAK
jgi:outer membrane protein assembly factor BamB